MALCLFVCAPVLGQALDGLCLRFSFAVRASGSWATLRRLGQRPQDQRAGQDQGGGMHRGESSFRRALSECDAPQLSAAFLLTAASPSPTRGSFAHPDWLDDVVALGLHLDNLISMAIRITVDAVIFDLDGTLVATDRFWPDAARAGAMRAFRDLGWDRELPDESVWMGMVGQPLEEAFAAAFPEMEEKNRQHLFDCCVEEEHRLLDEGRAGLLPGVAETLRWFAARDIPMGVASNCSQGYLDAILGGLGLGQWIEEARCLDSPGITNKAEMIADLLVSFGTRYGVMVGDRQGDRDAAWANGLPHVHLSRGYAQRGESLEAEATIPGLDCLPEVLGRRSEIVNRLIEQLDLKGGSETIGVIGRRCSGVRDLADDLVRGLSLGLSRVQGGAASRRDVELIHAYDWLRDPKVGRELDLSDPLAAVEQAMDLSGVKAALENPPEDVGLRVVALPFGLHPKLINLLDRVIWVEADEQVLERRLEGEFFLFGGRPREAHVREQVWPVERSLLERYPPKRLVHLTVDLTNALKPRVELAPGPHPGLS